MGHWFFFFLKSQVLNFFQQEIVLFNYVLSFPSEKEKALISALTTHSAHPESFQPISILWPVKTQSSEESLRHKVAFVGVVFISTNLPKAILKGSQAWK